MANSRSKLSYEPLDCPKLEILAYGCSTDGNKDERAAKYRKIERIAQQYLQGKPLYIRSILGPFDGQWINPWDRTTDRKRAPQRHPPTAKSVGRDSLYMRQKPTERFKEHSHIVKGGQLRDELQSKTVGSPVAQGQTKTRMTALQSMVTRISTRNPLPGTKVNKSIMIGHEKNVHRWLRRVHSGASEPRNEDQVFPEQESPSSRKPRTSSSGRYEHSNVKVNIHNEISGTRHKAQPLDSAFTLPRAYNPVSDTPRSQRNISRETPQLSVDIPTTRGTRRAGSNDITGSRSRNHGRSPRRTKPTLESATQPVDRRRSAHGSDGLDPVHLGAAVWLESQQQNEISAGLPIQASARGMDNSSGQHYEQRSITFKDSASIEPEINAQPGAPTGSSPDGKPAPKAFRRPRGSSQALPSSTRLSEFRFRRTEPSKAAYKNRPVVASQSPIRKRAGARRQEPQQRRHQSAPVTVRSSNVKPTWPLGKKTKNLISPLVSQHATERRAISREQVEEPPENPATMFLKKSKSEKGSETLDGDVKRSITSHATPAAKSRPPRSKEDGLLREASEPGQRYHDKSPRTERIPGSVAGASEQGVSLPKAHEVSPVNRALAFPDVALQDSNFCTQAAMLEAQQAFQAELESPLKTSAFSTAREFPGGASEQIKLSDTHTPMDLFADMPTLNTQQMFDEADLNFASTVKKTQKTKRASFAPSPSFGKGHEHNGDSMFEPFDASDSPPNRTPAASLSKHSPRDSDEPFVPLSHSLSKRTDAQPLTAMEDSTHQSPGISVGALAGSAGYPTNDDSALFLESTRVPRDDTRFTLEDDDLDATVDSLDDFLGTWRLESGMKLSKKPNDPI